MRSSKATEKLMMNATPFTLIDQQPDFIVINKAAGYDFHDEDALGKGVFNQVKTALALPTLYPVHRLDKMTSGILIFATNLPTAQRFQQLFNSHRIEKYYLAISDKKPIKKQGLIKGDMEKSRRGTWKLLRTAHNPAITQFFSYSIGRGQRLFLLKPHTGKTHQIRVALNSLSAPIIGDDYYYPKTAQSQNITVSNQADRGYLHAYAVRFSLHDKTYYYQQAPIEGELFQQSSTLAVLAKLQDLSQLSWPKIKA